MPIITIVWLLMLSGTALATTSHYSPLLPGEVYLPDDFKIDIFCVNKLIAKTCQNRKQSGTSVDREEISEVCKGKNCSLLRLLEAFCEKTFEEIPAQSMPQESSGTLMDTDNSRPLMSRYNITDDWLNSLSRSCQSKVRCVLGDCCYHVNAQSTFIEMLSDSLPRKYFRNRIVNINAVYPNTPMANYPIPTASPYARFSRSKREARGEVETVDATGKSGDKVEEGGERNGKVGGEESSDRSGKVGVKENGRMETVTRNGRFVSKVEDSSEVAVVVESKKGINNIQMDDIGKQGLIKKSGEMNGKREAMAMHWTATRKDSVK